jgi:hypothetical protein
LTLYSGLIEVIEDVTPGFCMRRDDLNGQLSTAVSADGWVLRERSMC